MSSPVKRPVVPAQAVPAKTLSTRKSRKHSQNTLIEQKTRIAEPKEPEPEPPNVLPSNPPLSRPERKKAAPATLHRKLEAALFSAGRHMTEDELAKLVGETRTKLVSVLGELQAEYELRDGALRIVQDGTSWKLTVAQPYTEIVQSIVSDTELPMPVMETLALIAYKSPMLQSDVVDARGNGAYDHIALLIERGFITREKESRTFRLRLAEKFFDYFALEGEQDIKEMLADVRRKRLEDERNKLAKKQKLGTLEVIELKGTQSTLPMPSAELTTLLHEEEHKPEVIIIPKDEKPEDKPQ